MRQICDGVKYMHDKNVIHLDLKPENVLCRTRSSYEIKIIDFGLARIYDPKEPLKVLFGTPEFVAPEVIQYEPICPKADMWSIGMFLFILFLLTMKCINLSLFRSDLLCPVVWFVTVFREHRSGNIHQCDSM